MKKKFKLQMPQMPVEYTKNAYGLRVKKCCASCAFKDETRLIKKRMCAKYDLEVCPCDCCKAWKMNEQLVRAGRGEKAEVKRYEYLMCVLEERKDMPLIEKDEDSVADIENTAEVKSIEEIRATFEQEHGSIYIKLTD